jgi:hypothetical protein
VIAMAGRNRRRRLEHLHANGRQMDREALNVIDHECRLRLDEGREAFLGAGNEQDRGNLGQSQIVFAVVEAQSSLLADQRLMEGDRRIKAFQRKIAPDQNVQNFHDRPPPSHRQQERRTARYNPGQIVRM